MPNAVEHGDRTAQYLLTADDLARDAGAVIFDCRFSLLDKTAGRRAFDDGHIPGARFADLERDLSAPAGLGGRHPLPDRERLAERFRQFGVDDDSNVVCYDQNSGAVAGRLWWLLRWLGHDRVCLLDGGLDAWIAAGYETTTATGDEPPADDPTTGDPMAGDPTAGESATGSFTARRPLTRLCTAAELPDPAVQLLDAREAARYRGESEPIDAIAGHIPGAISAPFADNLDDGRFKSPDSLKARFAALGLDPAVPTVCYCGSGVTAAHDILALLLAGFPEPVLYAGSWSEWITDPSRPIERGDQRKPTSSR